MGTRSIAPAYASVRLSKKRTETREKAATRRFTGVNLQQGHRWKRGSGRGHTRDTSVYDNGLLWHTSKYALKGEAPRLAIPPSLVLGVLALAHSTFGHPGVATKTLVVRAKYSWPPLTKDARDYVLSCECCRRKRATSLCVSMLPVRFLGPWNVIKIGIQDKGGRSQGGKKYLLVAGDGTSKFIFTYPLQSKAADGVANKLLVLMITFTFNCRPAAMVGGSL